MLERHWRFSPEKEGWSIARLRLLTSLASGRIPSRESAFKLSIELARVTFSGKLMFVAITNTRVCFHDA